MTIDEDDIDHARFDYVVRLWVWLVMNPEDSSKYRTVLKAARERVARNF